LAASLSAGIEPLIDDEHTRAEIAISQSYGLI